LANQEQVLVEATEEQLGLDQILLTPAEAEEAEALVLLLV
jgi:hypothetical protein